MKTNLETNEGGFKKFTIEINNLPDMERLGIQLRQSEDHKGYKHINTGNEDSFHKILLECERITKVRSVELF